MGNTIAAGRSRKARNITQSIQVKRVQLKSGIEVTCIIATEDNPPGSVKSVQWKLLSNRTVQGFEQAVELIEWYRARWEIGEPGVKVIWSGLDQVSVFVEGIQFVREQGL